MRCALTLLLALMVAIASCTASSTGSHRSRRNPRTGQYPTTRGVAQIAVDQPCEYLGTVHKMSRELIERLRASEHITLEEWRCMAEVIVEVNYEVGLKCHRKRVQFQEIADLQEERHRGCIADARTDIARCAVIQVDEEGRAGFCDKLVPAF